MRIGQGKYDHTEDTGPFIYDVDDSGRVLGIEILVASKVLAPGAWQEAQLPGGTRFNAAE